MKTNTLARLLAFIALAAGCTLVAENRVDRLYGRPDPADGSPGRGLRDLLPVRDHRQDHCGAGTAAMKPQGAWDRCFKGSARRFRTRSVAQP